MTRKRALTLRSAASLAALLLGAAVVRLLWYPGGYAPVMGVDRLLLITTGVALIVGPGLTALVYRPGKQGLLLDLGVLAAVEAVVLGWSLYVIHERRPMYAVFAVDRFEIVSAKEIDQSEIRYAELLRRPGHEPRLVYAELPTDPGAHGRLIDETVFNGGADIDRRPEFWRPYAAGVALVRRQARPLAKLLDTQDARAVRVRAWLARRSADSAVFSFLPLRGKGGDAAMILHADIGYPVAILPVDPW